MLAAVDVAADAVEATLEATAADAVVAASDAVEAGANEDAEDAATAQMCALHQEPGTSSQCFS